MIFLVQTKLSQTPISLRHQMIAIELFEFSTQHFGEDSYRIVKGY